MNGWNRSRAAALLALSLNVAGCGEGIGPSPSVIIGGAWKLNSIHVTSTNTTTVISRPENYTVTFEEGSRIGIKADCNVCGGTYSQAGEGLSITGTFCTRAYCGDASHDREFLEALDSATHVRMSDSQLTISSPKSEARFSR